MIENPYSINFQAGAESVYIYKGLQQCEDKIQAEIKAIGPKDEFEKKRIEGEYNIIDFGVAGDVSRFLSTRAIESLARYPIKSIPQGISRLNRLAEIIDPNTPDGHLLLKRIEATKLYIIALSSKKVPPAREYLEGTFGLTSDASIFKPVPDKDVENMWEQVVNKFSNCTELTLTRNDREIWAKFVRTNRITPTRASFRQIEEQLVPIMQKVVGVKDRPNYRIQFVNIPAYWMNWTDYDELGTRLRINEHANVRSRWRQGVDVRLFIHEILIHAFESHICAENIRLGKINPGYGIWTVPGPEQHVEGKANTLPYFIPELYAALSDVAKFEVDYRVYEGFIQRNAHLYSNGLVPFDGSVKEYLLDNLPSMDEKRAKTFIDSVTKDPRDTSYRLAYGFGYEYYRLAQRLAPQPKSPPFLSIGKPHAEVDKRIVFMKRSFEYPRTWDQTERLVEEIDPSTGKADKENRSGLLRRMLASSIVYFNHGPQESAKRKT